MLLLTLLAALPQTATPGAAPDARDETLPPNVVLVMTDDQGYGDFGFTGNPVLLTPHLDALASAALRVEPFYVHPVCTPTRAALMTGRYPERTRAIDTYVGRAMMDPDEVTLAEHLRAAGYATGIFGKWHLGDCAPLRPEDQGFDEVLVHRGGGIGQPSDPVGGEGRYTDPVLQWNGREQRFEGYCTDVYFDHALRFAAAQHARGRPFFAYVATNAPHSPFHDVPADWLARYAALDLSGVAPAAPGATPEQAARRLDRLARSYAMISNIDENIGRLVEGLDALEGKRGTLVVFLTDNGPDSARFCAGPGGTPLRGTKSSVHEGGVRSPLLLRWPGVLEAGATRRVLAQDIDLAPTILGACGVAAPAAMDGLDLWPVLGGDEAPDRGRVVHVQAHRGDRRVARHHFLVRRGDWKLVRPSGFGREAPAAGAPYQLFDLARDPGEARDLAGERQDLVAELLGLHDAWFADVARTRPDPWRPPRIHVGPAPAPVVLTRQDWRHEVGGPWGARSRGRWELEVLEAGRYRVLVRLPAQFEAEEAVVECEQGGVKRDARGAAAGARTVTLEVYLKKGPCHLRAWGRDGRGEFGAWQVELGPVVR